MSDVVSAQAVSGTSNELRASDGCWATPDEAGEVIVGVSERQATLQVTSGLNPLGNKSAGGGK
jgi:hypothetical protein